MGCRQAAQLLALTLLAVAGGTVAQGTARCSSTLLANSCVDKIMCGGKCFADLYTTGNYIALCDSACLSQLTAPTVSSCLAADKSSTTQAIIAPIVTTLPQICRSLGGQSAGSATGSTTDTSSDTSYDSSDLSGPCPSAYDDFSVCDDYLTGLSVSVAKSIVEQACSTQSTISRSDCVNRALESIEANSDNGVTTCPAACKKYLTDAPADCLDYLITVGYSSLPSFAQGIPRQLFEGCGVEHDLSNFPTAGPVGDLSTFFTGFTGGSLPTSRPGTGAGSGTGTGGGTGGGKTPTPAPRTAVGGVAGTVPVTGRAAGTESARGVAPAPAPGASFGLLPAAVARAAAGAPPAGGRRLLRAE